MHLTVNNFKFVAKHGELIQILQINSCVSQLSDEHSHSKIIMKVHRLATSQFASLFSRYLSEPNLRFPLWYVSSLDGIRIQKQL
jgi:hypothetical protein